MQHSHVLAKLNFKYNDGVTINRLTGGRCYV